MSQLTLEGVSIPIKAREPKRDLTPVQLKIWNFLRGVGPKTRKEIHNHPAFHDIATIGNRLRELKVLKYVEVVGRKDRSKLWRAK